MPERVEQPTAEQRPELNTEEIIRFIKESKKRTPVRVFVSGKLKGADWGALRTSEATGSGS